MSNEPDNNRPNNSIISVGETYRSYSSSVSTHNTLPVATYRVAFHPMEGFSLRRTTDLQVGGEKIYGNHLSRIERIKNTYRTLDGQRNLGIMLSGDKGMGKSLMLRMLSEAALNDLQIPVIIVDINEDGIAEFIDSWGEALVIFDEFEKTFPVMDRDEQNAQHKFLGLFDGMSSTSRIYALSVNKVGQVSDYLLNRPGRFHYHMRFNYPVADEVRAYLTDQAPTASNAEVEKVVAFSRKVSLNYDHLRAIAFELGPMRQKFDEVISELNIKRISPPTYNIEATFADGSITRGTGRLDLFDTSGDSTEYVVTTCAGGRVGLHIDASQTEIVGDTMLVNPAGVQFAGGTLPGFDSDEDEDFPAVTSVVLRLAGQSSLEF